MNRSTILLSTQRALLGAVTKNMKAITIGFSNNEYTMRVYFADAPSEDELGLLKDITAEVSADIPEFKVFKEESVVLDKETRFNKLEILDVWVYMEHPE